MKREEKEPDWFDPFYQNSPESKAMLDLLYRLAPRFAPLANEITDAQWSAFRVLAARREPSLITAKNFELANAIRAWLVSEHEMDTDAVGRLPLRVAIEMLDAGNPPLLEPPESGGTQQNYYGSVYQHSGEGHMNFPNHQSNLNFQGTQNVANSGGHVTAGDQVTAGHSASMTPHKSPLHAIWAAVKSWFVHRLIGKP